MFIQCMNASASRLFSSIPKWLLCNWFKVCIRVKWVMILFYLSALYCLLLPGHHRTSTMVVSHFTYALVKGHPFMIYVVSTCRCPLFRVDYDISYFDRNSWMSMHISMAIMLSFTLGILWSLFYQLFC